MDVEDQAKEVRRQPVVGHSPVTSPQCVYSRNGLGKRSFKTPDFLPSWETTGSRALLLQQWLWSQAGNAR